MKLKIKLVYSIAYNAFRDRGFDCAGLPCWEMAANTLTGAEFDEFKTLTNKAVEQFGGGDVGYCLEYYDDFYDWCRYEFDPYGCEDEA